MTSVLIDDSGCPVLTPQGNFQYVTGVEELKQQVINALTTHKGSETLHEEYGFDMQAVYLSMDFNKDIALKIASLEALNPRLTPGIKSIESCEATISGTTGYLYLELVGTNNVYLNDIFNMGEMT